MAKLIEITGKAISGEWGNDDENGSGIPVLRTTNFTNAGIINYSKVVTRIITKKNITEKFLRKGDILIEKSGGSDRQPVGRVVYFDAEENKYLFNNFTGLLRIIDPKTCFPKYLFYVLFYYYHNGYTIFFENKTTGLHNLKIDDYVKNCEIPLPLIDVQHQIAENLDKVTRTIDICNTILEKLDLLVKAKFVEMFGEIEHTVPLSFYIESLSAGKSLAGEEECENKVLKTGAVTYDYFDGLQVKNLPLDYNPLEEHRVKNYDVIISRMNTAELVGAAAYVWKAPLNTYLPDRLWRANLKHNVNPIFIWQVLIQQTTKEAIRKIASGTSGSMKNISKTGLLGIKVIEVSSSLQNQFADFVAQTEKAKLKVKQVLEKAETLKKALMQKYF